VSCGGPAQPGWRAKPSASGETRLELKPRAVGALRYNDAQLVAVPASTLGDAVARVVAETAEANGVSAPAPDGRLYAVAGEVAQVMRDRPPPYSLVEFALAHHGIIEPSPHLLVLAAERTDVDGILEELRGRLPGILAGAHFSRLGVGSATGGDGKARVVVALQESAVETDPIPRRVDAHAAFPLRGRTLHPYVHPRVFVTGLDGKVTPIPVVRDGDAAFRAEITCPQGQGRIRVEVLAEDKGGDPSVLANFPVWCGEEPPAEASVVSHADDDAPVGDIAETERRLFDLLNADRLDAGLPPLVWSDKAASIARKHSVEMRDKGFVGHVSPTSGGAADRAKAGGLATPLVLENIARAYSPREAEEGLMNSPGHRANLLSPHATHVGVGVSLGDEGTGQRALYVTQLFYRVSPTVDPAVARRDARAALVSARVVAKAPALMADPLLDEVAQEYAATLAAGGTREDAGARASGRLDGVGDRFREVLTVAAVAGDTGEWIGDAVLDPTISAYGLGLAQGTHAGLGEGALFIVVVLARGR
jgi:uncharacterized protein YkwD